MDLDLKLHVITDFLRYFFTHLTQGDSELLRITKGHNIGVQFKL